MRYLHHNRHIVWFDKETIEGFDKHDLGNGQKLQLIITNSRAEYSPEVGFIHNSCEPFFDKGDKVLVLYDVFRLGKYPDLAKGEQVRTVGKDENGNDLYWARAKEVVAKWVGGDEGHWQPKPEWVLVEAPDKKKEAEEKKVGLIIIPQSVAANLAEEKRKKQHWAKVRFSNSECVSENNVVLIAKWQFIPFDTVGMLAVHEDNLLAIKT